MRKLFALIGVAALLLATNLRAQTDSGISLKAFAPLTDASNYTACPYMTYAPDKPTHVGGGLLLLYNINNNLGAGLGLDWLGHLSLISLNFQAHAAIHPFSFIGGNGWLTKLEANPFALVGLGSAYSGAGNFNGGAATIQAAGLSFKVFKIGGGQVDLGAAISNWSGAGAYSGKDYHIFAAWHKGNPAAMAVN